MALWSSVVLALVVLSLVQVEGVRLCGRRLADHLNLICEQYGGFHAPKRDVSDKALMIKRPAVHPLNRRFESEPEELSGGVVDECCRKQCSVATLVSYCADADRANIADIEDFLPSAIANNEGVQFQPVHQASSAAAESEESLPATAAAHSSHPNIGQFVRDRVYFMVMVPSAWSPPQHQEDTSLSQHQEDISLGDYSF